MTRTARERVGDDVRKHLKRTIAVCAVAFVVLVMWPTVVTFSESCVVCASRRTGTRVSSLFGLMSWRDESEVSESAVLTDGLLDAGHLHAWGDLSRNTRGLFRSSVACGGPTAGPLAYAYAFEPQFRADVQACIARGELTREQAGRAIGRTLPDGDPGHAVLDELLDRLDRPPERIR